MIDNLLRKTKLVQTLEQACRIQEDTITKAFVNLGNQRREINQLKSKVEELENTNLGAHDMNILFSAIVSYHDVVVNRLCAPDPIIVRADVRHIFDKYQVNLPK